MEKKQTNTAEYVINPEADRILLGLMRRMMIEMMILASGVMCAMFYVNTPARNNPLWPHHQFIDFFSVLLVVVPFYMRVHQLYDLRLRIGRNLINDKKWAQAVAALDAFAVPFTRWLDSTGEAHYLLAKAYAGVGKAEQAEAAREFVIKHRKGQWSEKAETEPIGKPAPTGVAKGTPRKKK